MSNRFARVVLSSLAGAALYIAAGCDHHEPCKDMAGPPDMASSMDDMSNTPRDMAMCNPASDPGCMPMDMAVPPRDMATPPSDMTTTPADMTTTPADMTMMPADMTMTPADMTMMPADMTMMPADMTMTPADMTMTPADMTMTPADMTMPPRDMTMPPGDMTMPPRDMAMPPGDMAMPMGRIGDACTADSGCVAGTMPKCWKTNVLDNPMAPPTPGGYCTSTCATDTDCGAGARCTSIGSAKYCLAACNNATTCRKPGYACAYVGGGVCYPDTIFDCDPKSPMGTCTEAGTMKAGGCVRGAYEDKGSCQATCTVGPGTCADKPMGVKRQCVFYNGTASGDAFKGALCYASVASPKMPGATCSYVNECTDGNQCDQVDRKCHQLCVQGGMPACTTGMCADAFMSMAMGPGLCR